MAKIKTTSGFSIEIDEAVLDDAELLEMLIEIDEENFASFATVLKKLLGEDGKKKLYDHVRNEEGRVPYGALSAELNDIIQGLNSKKK